MTEEQLQKFYAMAEPRSENAIRKAEERKMKRKEIKHKFFRDPRVVCYWCNYNKVEVISITFVPQGGWCVFFKEKGE